MDVTKGQLINSRYLLDARIASYGHVELYNALDQQLDRPVTLQILVEPGASDPDLSEPFLEHQRIASSVYNCPALLAVYDAGTWKGLPFSVMERHSGVTPITLYRPDTVPDTEALLRVTRQIAEALDCCRKAGLADWTFSPDAVCIDPDGNARLAIIEGLEGQASSSCAADDASALAGLLRLMLAGRSDAVPSALRGSYASAPLLALLDRLDPNSDNQLADASHVVEEIAKLEQAALQPTQSHEPDANQAINGQAQSLISPSPAFDPSEAPTLVAQVLPSSQAEETYAPAAPYLHVTEPSTSPAPERHNNGIVPGNFPYRALAVTGGALLAALVLVVLWYRSSNAVSPTALSMEKLVQPATTTATPLPLASVPDLRGKSVDQARTAVEEAGLSLAMADAVTDPDLPPDTVARQEPGPGTTLQAGSPVTVSLNLIPDNQGVIEPAPPKRDPGPPDAKRKNDNNKKDRDDKDDD